MKNPFRKTTADALRFAEQDVQSTESTISDLQHERQAVLLDSDLAQIQAIDQKISDQFRVLAVHKDRVTALKAQARREQYDQLERERDAQVAALEQKFAASQAKAQELEATVKRMGDLYFELLELREQAFLAWPAMLPRPSYELLHKSTLPREFSWALYAAGRPTAMSPCHIPNPSNQGLGVQGISPLGISGAIEAEQAAIVELAKAEPITLPEQEDAA
jgi:hypothetical protein